MKKEEMIEKIREKVILANNPECETYEDALKKEYRRCGSLFAYDIKSVQNDGDGDYVKVDRHLHTVEGFSGNLKRYSDVADEYYIVYRNVLDEYLMPTKERCDKNGIPASMQRKRHNFTILGLPLTLERILVAIEYKHNKIWSFQYQTNIGFYINSFSQDKIIWQPNQTLESQSIETIEKIYNILND